MLSHLKKEEKLLLYILKTKCKDSHALRTSDFSEINWEALYQLSIQHSVAPLLYFHLNNFFSAKDIPSEILTKLHKIYFSNAAKNLTIYHNLSNIIKTLNENAIPFVLLKGAHLCELVYENISLRSMADVDILFKKKDLNHAQEVINRLGCNNDLNLDYHWYLEQFLNLDMNGIWSRVQSADIGGQQTLVLSPVDLILHLCIHSAFHHNFQFVCLRSLYDIKITIEHYNSDIEWDELIFRSKEWKVQNSVYMSLLLAKNLLQANVPNKVLNKLYSPTFDSEKLDWAIDQIFNTEPGGLSLSPYFWQLFRPGFSLNKVISFAKIIFPSPEFISQKYYTVSGTMQNYLYYFVRFKDHFYMYLKAIFLILCRNDQMQTVLRNQIRQIEMRDWLSSE